jgi:hypothetical protein
VISPRPAREDVADRIDLDGTAGLARPADEDVAHIRVLA